MMNKISILMALYLLLIGSALAQELTIYLENSQGIIFYPPENLSLPVRGTDAKDKLTRPWFQAFPILGDYTIVEINEQLIRLQAQTGKGKLLQRLYGKGGLVLLSDLKASGLWRSRANAPLKSFGALSVPALS
ncbi:secreted protein, partial [Candidatus Thiomargarita nelsonii]